MTGDIVDLEDPWLPSDEKQRLNSRTLILGSKDREAFNYQGLVERMWKKLGGQDSRGGRGLNRKDLESGLALARAFFEGDAETIGKRLKTKAA